MFPRDVAICHSERHPILYLIPEPISAAQLVEARACPHPTSQSLIQQPPVEREIPLGLGRFYLQGSEHLIPLRCDFGQNFAWIRRPVLVNQLSRVLRIVRFAKQEADDHPRSRRQLNNRL